MVNFRAIKDYAENYNLVVTDLVDQGDFLNTLGIQERFVALSKNMEKKKIAKERRCIQVNYVTFETDWKVKS